MEKITDSKCGVPPEWFRKYPQTTKPTRALLQDLDQNLDDPRSGMNEAAEDGKPKSWKGECHLTLCCKTSDSDAADDCLP